MESFTDHRDPVVNEKGAFEGELALARGVAAYRLISKKLSSREPRCAVLTQKCLPRFRVKLPKISASRRLPSMLGLAHLSTWSGTKSCADMGTHCCACLQDLNIKHIF
jgi:hypothetical protein